MPHLDRLKEKRMLSSRSSTRSRSSTQKLSKVKITFISKEIRRQRKEGKPQKQSIAIAFSKARKKFGDKGLTLKRSNPSNRNTRRVLGSLIGLALTLAILREFTKRGNPNNKKKMSGHLKNRRVGLMKRRGFNTRIRRR